MNLILIVVALLAIAAVLLKLVLGFPIIGGVLPRIWRRRLPLNRDGSFVDTGESMIEDEVGFYYVDPITFEWLGLGMPLTKSLVRLTSTGEPVEPDFEVAGG